MISDSINDEKGLRGLDLSTEYRTGETDLVTEFYRPCVRRADSYDRAIGYFRSTVYDVTGDMFIDFASRGGRIRLVCSPELDADDVRAMERGYEERDQIVARALERNLTQLLADNQSHDRCEVLATLVRVRALDVRIAVLPASSGIFHEKLGLFHDRYGTTVSFKGSSNETWSGWHRRGNLESFDVFCSWKGGRESDRVSRHAQYFQQLWDNEISTVRTVSLPNSVSEALLKVSKSRLEDLPRSPSAEVRGRELLPHQEAALRAWHSRGRVGILEHATGSGKTFTALVALREHLAEGGVAVVLVPSRLLLRQWLDEIRETLADVTVLPAGATNTRWRDDERLRRFSSPDASVGKRVVLATMQTASSREFLSHLTQGDHLMLVVDEVHQIGSPRHSECMSIQAAARLGLSATPQRYGDPEGTERIMRYFDGVVPPPFTLTDAIHAGRLVPYAYYPHPVQLTADEAHSWKEWTLRIAKEIGRSSNNEGLSAPLTDKVKLLLIERARIAKKAERKIQLALDVLKENPQSTDRWLVYCEDRDQMSRVRAAVTSSGIVCQEYHSAMEADSSATLEWFRRYGGVLASIRCLDEGVDIPEITHALILASSQNPRQFIQRRGRVLRAAAGKAVAVIHDAIVVPDVEESEPLQVALARSELRRAIEFADSAINRAASVQLREIAMSINMNPESLYDTGLEDDSNE